MGELVGQVVAENARRAWILDEDVQIDMHELAAAINYCGRSGRDSGAVLELGHRLRRLDETRGSEPQAALASSWTSIAPEPLYEGLGQERYLPILKAGRRRWAQALGLAGCFDLNHPDVAFDQASAIGMRWLAMFHPDFSKIKPDNSCDLIIPARRDISSTFFASLMSFGQDLKVENSFERATAAAQSLATDFNVCGNTKIGNAAKMQEFGAWAEGAWLGHSTAEAPKSGAKGPRL